MAQGKSDQGFTFFPGKKVNESKRKREGDYKFPKKP